MSEALPPSGLYDLDSWEMVGDETYHLTQAAFLGLLRERVAGQVIGRLEPIDMAYVWMLPNSQDFAVPDMALSHVVAALDQGRSVSLHGASQEAIDAVKRVVLAMVGGGRA